MVLQKVLKIDHLRDWNALERTVGMLIPPKKLEGSLRTLRTAGGKRQLKSVSRHVSPTGQKTLKHYVCTHVDWHVEVIGFERVCHFPESTEGIVPGRLLKAKRLLWLTALLPEKDKDRTFLIYV